MNIGDNDLDKTFRDKVHFGTSESEFDEAAWQAIEKRLNRKDRKVLFFKLACSMVLLISMSYGINFYFGNDFIDKHNKQKTAKISKDSSIKDNSQKGRHVLLNKVPQITQATKSLPNDTNYSFHSSIDLTKTNINSEKDIAFLRIDSLNTNQYDLDTRNEHIAYSSGSIFPDTIIIKEDTSDREETSTIAKEIAQVNKKAKKVDIGFSFSAGPELNTTDKLSNASKNTSFGIAFFAQKSKFKFSIGANYGLKSYNTSATQYDNIKKSRQELINNISANCNILEVPLLASYQIWGTKKDVLYFNAGISSYLMLKETYNFEYYAETQRPDYLLTVRNKNQHYFKVIQLSANYSLPVKNSLSRIGIEPYLKLPLQGVGEGKVFLKSYGINLNFSYGLSKK